MPGPGGGSRGGGGFRGGGFSSGGFSGGGHRGGGFGRGPRRPYRGFGGPFGFGWYHRPYMYGGGCLGGLLGAFMAPIILIVFAAAFVFASFGNAFGSLSQGGDIYYDENTFQDYANEQYNAEFGGRGAYEDNILIVFLVDDVEYYDYAYIAWVGDHIDTDINLMFGAENTEFGLAISSYVNLNSYKYSLDSNLAQVIGRMEEKITALGGDSSFTCSEERAEFDSHLTNKTDMQLSADTVDAALKGFTEATGIPIVIVVDEIETVFGRSFSSNTIITLVLAGILVVIAIVLIVKAVKGNKNNRSRNSNNSGSNYNNGSQNNYNNGSDNNYW